MITHIVGIVDGHDVLYLPDRDLIFCKNTTISYQVLRGALIKRETDKLPLKSNLTLLVDGEIVTLGCLTTNLDNCRNIYNEIKKIKNGRKLGTK